MDGHTRGMLGAAIPLLRLLEPEMAHRAALLGLRAGVVKRAPADPPGMEVRALGLRFPNPIGLAAGFDKDGVAAGPLMRAGFGFVEVGTVTPRPQAGNPRPRLFRLTRERAVINRMGFNNGGVEALRERLAALRERPVPLGVNLGINKEGAEPERDYPAMVRAVAPVADYVVVNVSSPNTPGLRDLQGEARLGAILRAIAAEAPVRPPLLVKIAPDLAPRGIEAVVDAAFEGGCEGLIVGNTTISRPAGLGRHAAQAGGLSGPPLQTLARQALAVAARHAQGRLVLIACGGIDSGDEVKARLEAGASLVQVYTTFAYEGPGGIVRMKQEMKG